MKAKLMIITGEQIINRLDVMQLGLNVEGRTRKNRLYLANAGVWK